MSNCASRKTSPRPVASIVFEENSSLSDNGTDINYDKDGIHKEAPCQFEPHKDTSADQDLDHVISWALSQVQGIIEEVGEHEERKETIQRSTSKNVNILEKKNSAVDKNEDQMQTNADRNCDEKHNL